VNRSKTFFKKIIENLAVVKITMRTQKNMVQEQTKEMLNKFGELE
jgi:hypothetical protein